MKNQTLTFITASLVTISLSGCFNNESKTPVANSPSTPGQTTNTGTAISWGGPPNIAMLPLIAEKQGFLTKAGLTATRQDIQTGKLAMDAVNSGKLDIGIIVDTNVAFVKFQPAKIKVVATITEKTDDAIIARKDKGITNAKQLEGKKVGVTFGTTSHAMTMAYLQANGVDISKVNFVNQPPPALQAAIIKGDIDAAALWQPLRFNAKAALKDQAIELRGNPPYVARALVVVSEDYAAKHAPEITNFLKGLVEGENYAKSNPVEVQSFLSKAVGIPANVLSGSWNDYKLGVSLSKDVISDIEKQGKWIIATQSEFKTKPLPNYAEVVDPTFLKQVNADKVTGF
jgi:ABC-type nitrate/sulfonate/bicarbonate transport system substrate-binding protein